MGFQIAKSFDGMYQNDMDDNGSITDESNALLVVHSMHIEYVGGGALSKYAYLPYLRQQVRHPMKIMAIGAKKENII